jgi:hypothetical protein
MLRLVEPQAASDSVGVGPASLRGLAWLARVGPAPVAAWACAMGWGKRVAMRHAQRVVAHGWVERCPTARGEGSLLVVTRAGVQVTGLELRPAHTPAPTWWAHWRACAWTAAWLECRGREWLGQREVLELEQWSGQARWSDSRGRRVARHRPDLVARGSTPVEVELARKSDSRMGGLMTMYGGWVAAGRIPGVMYVVGSEQTRERIARIAGEHELNVRIELLEAIVEEALEARQAARVA